MGFELALPSEKGPNNICLHFSAVVERNNLYSKQLVLALELKVP